MNRLFSGAVIAIGITLSLTSLTKAQNPTPPPAPVPPATEKETPTEQRERRRVPAFGPQIGFFFPTSGRTRDAFGETWVNYGIGFQPLDLQTRRGSATLDIAAFSARRSGARAFVVPISLIYKIALGGGRDVEGETDRGINPYTGFSLGLYLTDLRADRYNVSSGWQGGFGGSALFGVTYQRSIFVEARYHLISELKTFDLSGLNLSVGARF
ncbi:MAG: hypothetical protein H7145_15980 [Akkermansiaceae bacterium]|nr:hypothetical protein [Armatimonadota bacterium]